MPGIKTSHLPLNPLPDLLPPTLLEELSLTYQTDKSNQVRLPGTALVLCLLHALLHHPKLTQRLLEEIYQQQTGQSTDHSTFARRLATINPAYFQALYQHLYDKLTPDTPRTTLSTLRVRFLDATTVTLSAKLLSFGLLNKTSNPNKTLRHVKSVLALHPEGFPQFLKLCRDKADKSDCVALGDTMLEQTQPNDLWVFDKGCHDRKRLLALHQKGSYFLTPQSQQALQCQEPVFEATAPVQDQAPAKGEASYRLTGVCCATFGNGQETAKEQACWNELPLVVLFGYRFDERKAIWRPLTLLTNLPLEKASQRIGPYSYGEVAALYRERWSIEAFFKFLKQYLSLDHFVSRSENGIEVMLYMSMIAALLLIWYQRQTQIDRGWRSVKSWLAFDVQAWLQQELTSLFARPSPLGGAVPASPLSKRE